MNPPNEPVSMSPLIAVGVDADELRARLPFFAMDLLVTGSVRDAVTAVADHRMVLLPDFGVAREVMLEVSDGDVEWTDWCIRCAQGFDSPVNGDGAL